MESKVTYGLETHSSVTSHFPYSSPQLHESVQTYLPQQLKYTVQEPKSNYLIKPIMNPLRGLLGRRRGNRASRPPPSPPPPFMVWKCSIHEIPDREACPAFFATAPELRRHYIRDHQMPPLDVSFNQQTLMRRRRLPEGRELEPPRFPNARTFVRGENFDPRWPTGPVNDEYGPWMVRPRGPVVESLQDARERREERNPKVWERMFVPDWYYDEISRRVRMARGEMWA